MGKRGPKPKTHCKNGHERTPENLDAYKQCKTCRKAYQAEYRRTHDRKKYYKEPKTNFVRGRKLAPERKAWLDAAIADGWPIQQIIDTYGIGTATVKRYYPDYHGMSSVEAGSLSQSIQRSVLMKPSPKYAA